MDTNLFVSLSFAIVTNWSTISSTDTFHTNADGFVLQAKQVTQVGVVSSNTVGWVYYKRDVVRCVLEEQPCGIKTQWRTIPEYHVISTPK